MVEFDHARACGEARSLTGAFTTFYRLVSDHRRLFGV